MLLALALLFDLPTAGCSGAGRLLLLLLLLLQVVRVRSFGSTAPALLLLLLLLEVAGAVAGALAGAATFPSATAELLRWSRFTMPPSALAEGSIALFAGLAIGCFAPLLLFGLPRAESGAANGAESEPRAVPLPPFGLPRALLGTECVAAAGTASPGTSGAGPRALLGGGMVTGLGMLKAVLFGRQSTSGGRRTSNYLETEVLATNGEAHMYGKRPIDQGSHDMAFLFLPQ